MPTTELGGVLPDDELQAQKVTPYNTYLLTLLEPAVRLAGIRLSSTANVNMNTGTATTLYTCPTGFSCLILRVIVRDASASLTTASYSFGWNSAAFDNVIANATHTELTGSTLYTILNAKAGATKGAAGGTFKVLMNTSQGSAATTTMDVYGVLI